MRFYIQDIKKISLILCCCFPFIGPNLGTDVQPFALILSIIILFFYSDFNISNKFIIPTAICTVALFVFSLPFVPMLDVAKRMFSYVSILLIPLAVEKSGIDIRSIRFERLMKLIMLVWLIVGLIQILVDKYFLSSIVPLMRTSDDRGVTSLGSEPSFYGYMCFIFFLIAKDFAKNREFFMLLQIFQTLFIAQSTVAIIYFVAFFFFWGIRQIISFNKIRFIVLTVAIICFVLAILFILKSDSSRRIVVLLQHIISQNKEWNDIEYTGISGNVRWGAIVKSFTNHGIPSFMGRDKYVALSGFGGVIYELGFFSIFLFSMVWKYILLAYSKEEGWVILLAVTIMMFSAVQLSLPMLAFYLGYCQIRSESLVISNGERKENLNHEK